MVAGRFVWQVGAAEFAGRRRPFFLLLPRALLEPRSLTFPFCMGQLRLGSGHTTPLYSVIGGGTAILHRLDQVSPPSSS
jgi:hypothetical protein